MFKKCKKIRHIPFRKRKGGKGGKGGKTVFGK